LKQEINIKTDITRFYKVLPELCKYFTAESRQETTPVGYFKVANSFGLSDMHGNVWEWCADEWHSNYDGAPIDGSVWLDGDEDKSPLRGGSWAVNPNNCRSAIRDIYDRRDDHYSNIGFRLVCDGGRTL
jgi:formylglycine-generating enzyme required for sulfatase activity